jgi:hypothetical protein
MENTILRAEKDEENSCMVIETEQGQNWVSCAECRIGEIGCSYLRNKWGINPCLYRRGVRVGRGLEPDPRDVVKIVQNNLDVYANMLDKEAPFLKAERDMLERFLMMERQELEKARSMFSRTNLK